MSAPLPAAASSVPGLLADPVVALLLVVTAGLALGRLQVRGLSLGASGVIFAALAAGHLGAHLPPEVGTLGLVLFVYAVGLNAGPSFFRAFLRQGKELALMAVGIVASAALGVGLLAWALGLPTDLAVGIFTGAMTSTPGLAAGLEALPESGQLAVGYGLAYPFGVVAVVLFVQLLPRFLGTPLAEAAGPPDGEEQNRRIEKVLVEVHNPAVIGTLLSELELPARNVQIPRVLVGDRMVPVTPELVLEEGMVLLVVGRAYRLDRVVPMLGSEARRSDFYMEVDGYRRPVVVSSPRVVGRTIGELEVLKNFGVTVVRLHRHDLEFVPGNHELLQFGDQLTVVGEPPSVTRFAEHCGHRATSADVTDLISLGAGLLVGIALGKTEVWLGTAHFSLGLAGGPLVAGLLLGHFERVGPFTASLPRAARMLLQELGLVGFLAYAGVRAGGSLVPVLAAQGPKLALAAALGAALPLVVGLALARGVLGLGLLETLGATCGAMTSTPGLGCITAETDSDRPVVSYAAAYPVALVVTTIVTGALVRALGSG